MTKAHTIKWDFFLSRKLCMGSFKIVQEEKSRLSTFLICGKSLLLKYLTYHFWFTYSLHGCHRSVSNRDEGQRKGQKEKAVIFDDNYLKSNYLTYSLVGINPHGGFFPCPVPRALLHGIT